MRRSARVWLAVFLSLGLGWPLVAAAAEAGLRQLLLCDLEAPAGALNLGGEFPGATGSFDVGRESAHDGRSGGRLGFDITRGAYVAWFLDLPEPLVEGARTLSLWVRSDAPGRSVHCKTRDATGQEHIRYGTVLAAADWQQLTFDLTRHDAHWSGANDGVIHWPVSMIQIGVETKSSPKTGWVDLDTLVVTTAAGPDRQPGLRFRLESGRYGNLFTVGEAVALTLGCTRLEDGPGTAWTGTYAVRDWLDREVAHGRLAGPDLRRGEETRLPLRLEGLAAGAFRLELSLRTDSGATLAPPLAARFGVLPGPNPPPCSWVGTCLHGGHGWGHGDLRFLELLSAAGIGVVREEFGWSSIEKAKGQYATQPTMEALVDELNRRDIRLNLLLTYGNELYENPLDPQAYARWAGWMATHYAGRVQTFEIWNEPANFLFQKQYGGERFGNAPWIAKFVELTRAASAAIRAARPDAEIAIAAEDAWPTLEQMLREGIGPAGDLVAIHPYCHGQPRPEREWFLRDMGRELRSVSQGLGGPARVVITEAGWTTYEGEMEYLAIAGGYPRSSLAHQAQYLVRLFLTARAAGADYATQYDFRDDGSQRNYTEHNFGLVYLDATPKPALLAVSALTRLVGQGRFVADLSPDPVRLRAYAFEVGGRPLVAAYAVEGCADLSLRVGVPQVEVADLMGNRTPRLCPKGVLDLALTETPVYVLGAAAGVTRAARLVVDRAEVEVAAGDEVRVPFRCENRTGGRVWPRLRCETAAPLAAEARWLGRGWCPWLADGETAEGELRVRCPVRGPAEAIPVRLQVRLGDQVRESAVSIRVVPPLAVRFGSLGPVAGGTGFEVQVSSRSQRPLGLRVLPLTVPAVRVEPQTACGRLEPGQSRGLAFRLNGPLPPTLRVTVDVATHDGWSATATGGLIPGTVSRLPAAPAGAGAGPGDAWRGVPAFRLDDATVYTRAPGQSGWEGAADLSAAVRLGWCDEGLACTVTVADDTFDQPYTDTSIWQADSVQLAVAPGLTGPDRLEVGLARTPQGDRCFTYSPLPGTPAAAPPVRAVTRPDANGREMTYEVLIPWDRLPGVRPAAGTAFRFSLLVNDSDGHGRRGWLHAFDGIGVTKDPTQFGAMTLAAPGR